MGTGSARDTSAGTGAGLPWPEAFADLLPAIRDDWDLRDEILLTRRLSGKSGALVFAADVSSREFSGQAILKLDRAPDPSWNEQSEAERHRLAFDSAPEYAARHLPSLLHTLHRDSQLAILSSVAGRGLEYSLPWHLCPFDRQLETLGRVSRELLEDWNRDYVLAPGLVEPRALLASWLRYRLDPVESRIHGFLADECNLSPDEPSVSYEGHWYPNPLAFATAARVLPEKVQLRAATGIQHGDFHGFNLLIGSAPAAEQDYFVIDLANYENDQFLFYDHALFELNYLLFGREHVDDANWESLLDHLSYFRHLQGYDGLRGDDVGLMEMVRTLRRAVLDWIDRHESNRLSYMEAQYLLARVAVGLNFVNKPISAESRRKAFMYAASNLKDYLKINAVEWPKHGPPFGTQAAPRVGAASTPAASSGAAAVATHEDPPLPGKPAIAVLAFENLSGDPEQEYFADGVSLEILAALARIDWLLVISRGSTFAYKGQAVDPKRVSRELGVHYVVEGDVRKAGERVRVSVRLEDGRNGHTIWTERYERPLADVLALQDEIAETIVNNIDSELKASERETGHRRREPLSVWDRFQKGLWHVFRFTEEDDEIARGHMLRLVETAPDFALPHAVLAIIDTREVLLGSAEDADAVIASALGQARRAVRLDDRSSVARIALGRVHTLLGNFEDAITETEMAIALNPSSSVAYAHHAFALLSSGRATEALESLETSIRLSPRGPGLAVKLLGKAWALYDLDRAAEAVDVIQRAPHRRDTEAFRWILLAALYAHLDRPEDARAAAEALIRIRKNMTVGRFAGSWKHFAPEVLDRFVRDLRKAGVPE